MNKVSNAEAPAARVAGLSPERDPQLVGNYVKVDHHIQKRDSVDEACKNFRCSQSEEQIKRPDGPDQKDCVVCSFGTRGWDPSLNHVCRKHKINVEEDLGQLLLEEDEDRGVKQSRRDLVAATWKHFRHSRGEEEARRKSGSFHMYCNRCSWKASDCGRARRHLLSIHDIDVKVDVGQKAEEEPEELKVPRRELVAATWKHFRPPQGDEKVKTSCNHNRKYCQICSWGTYRCGLAVRHLLKKHKIDVAAELLRGLPRLQKVAEELVMESPPSKQAADELIIGSPPSKQVEEEMLMGSPPSKQAEEELIMGSPPSKQVEEEMVMGSPPSKQAEEELIMGSPPSKQVEEELVMGSPPSKQVEEELVMGSPPLKQVEEEPVMGSPPSKQVELQISPQSLGRKSRRLLAAATWSHFRGSRGTERDRTGSGAYVMYCKFCSWWTCQWEDGCNHLLREHDIDVEGRQEQILRSRQEEEPRVNEELPIPKRSREEEPDEELPIPNSRELTNETWTHFHRTTEELAKKGCLYSMRCNSCLWPTLRSDYAQKHLFVRHGIDVRKQLTLQMFKRARVNEELPTAPAPLITENVDMHSSDTNISVNPEQAAQTDNAIIGYNVDTFSSDTRIPATPEQAAHDKAMTGNDVDMHSSNTNNSSVTPELAAQIDTAIAALPRAHLEKPITDEKFQSRDEALKRLQDWAFTQGFAIITNTTRADRVHYGCSKHRGKLVRTTRMTDPEGRERPLKKTREGGCCWSAYISKRKATGDLWVFTWKHDKHNHPPNPNPFSYGQHRAKQPYLSLYHSRGTIKADESYTGSEKTLSKQEEIRQILHHLKKYDFLVQVRYDITQQGVARDIFFISPTQIELGWRFVSGFMYQTDTTFHTEGGRLPLYSMIGVTNTGHSFPVAYCYITSKSAVSFEFVARALTRYVFNDLPEAEVIITDFTQGLGAAIAAKARSDSTEYSQMSWATGVLGGDNRTKVQLQLSELHATEAIKKRLVHGEQYNSRKKKEIANLVDDWIKAPANGISEAREKLLEQLEPEDREHLISQYQPHEVNLLRAYTRTYRNLGCDSTQRNACCHPITKRTLSQDQPISKAIEYIAEDFRSTIANHYLSVSFRSVILDLTAFRDLGDLLTGYCLEKAMPEWSAAKILAREEAAGLEKAMADWATAITPDEVATVDGCLGCMWTCELPLRYGIPCRHWMYPALVWKCQLPLSLFHPRWFHETPKGTARGWKMSWGNTSAENECNMSAENDMTAGDMSDGNPLVVSTENESNMNTGNYVKLSAGERFNMGAGNSDRGSGNSDRGAKNSDRGLGTS